MCIMSMTLVLCLEDTKNKRLYGLCSHVGMWIRLAMQCAERGGGGRGQTREI